MSSYFSPQDQSDFINRANVEVGKDRAVKIIWIQMVSTSPFPAEQSQAWKLESTQESKGSFSWKKTECKFKLDRHLKTGSEC